MKHPSWERRERDRAFQSAVNDRMKAPVLMLIPLLIFAGFVYGELGVIPPLAVIFASLAYSLVFFWSLHRARQLALKTMALDDEPPEGYRPPDV
ncbi:MAG: hypothetical protein AAGG55_07200 [Pseudomonadota bacterium]